MFSTDPRSRGGLTPAALKSTLNASMASSGSPRPARHRLAGFALALLLASSRAVFAADAVLYRVFLQDGSTLVSYGEYARVADKVIVSIPIGDSPSGPSLQLVTISQSDVDWEQTDRYTQAVRAKRYADTRGEEDYALLGARVTQALNDVALTPDPKRRLEMAEEARRNLVQWPSQNYGYRAADVAQLAALFDEVISELRVAAGQSKFDVNLVATTVVAPPMALLPEPTAEDILDQAVSAAKLATEPYEREALLRSVTASLEPRAKTDERAAALYARASKALAAEEKIGKAYKDLSASSLATARAAAARADVRGLQGIIERVLRADDGLGRQRPQETAALLASLDLRLDEARRLRLARDAWAVRLEAFATYRRQVALPIDLFRRSRAWLEDVKELAGPAPRALELLDQRLALGRRTLQLATAPPELASVQSSLGAAFQLAQRACLTRRAAVSTGDIKQAWDASSAAAGALMLFDNALKELDRLTARPGGLPSSTDVAAPGTASPPAAQTPKTTPSIVR
jgi:hypothetical protein